MTEVKIIKRWHSWQVGEVVAVSEANAVKLIRNGYAESVKQEVKTKTKK
jgi:hypothetical protein